MAALMKLCGGGGGDPAPAPAAGEDEAGGEAPAGEEGDKEKDMVPKAAMDAALVKVRTDLKAELRAATQARADVAPWVGDVSLALDSAEDVSRAAAKALGVSGATTIHRDALLPVIQAQPKPGERRRTAEPTLALDSAAANSLATRFPGAANIALG